MNPVLNRIRDATQGTEYDGRLWLVGGYVRDRLLGLPDSPDADFVLESDAGAATRFLFERGIGENPPVVYPRFGTAMLQVDGAQIEFVTARKESYESDSRKPFVEPATLVDDAFRRDFTVNALFENLHSGENRDPTGLGFSDLRSEILRTPLEPKQTFSDDPLRMLRAVRFRGKLGFHYAPGIEEAIAEMAPRLQVISAERIRDEFAKMMVLPDPASCLRDLMRLGLAEQFAPELAAMNGVDQGTFHHLDVWNHSVAVVDNLKSSDLGLALAGLLHDVGKPRTRTVEPNGRIRFFSHEVVGAEMAFELLDRLRFPHALCARVAKLVRNHMRLGSSPEFTPTAARRLLRDLGDDTEPLLELCEADANALKAGVRQLDLNAIRDQIAAVQTQVAVKDLESPLSGQEIMELLNAPAGPAIGQAKAWLTERVLEGDIAPGDKVAARRELAQFKLERE
ncbi:MAG: Multifunctional CCA protein [Fimbriimonadaceae bacterium]|nr:Multifunctional CCA protein [Fimbriimonadaceae bacterium]